MPGRPPDHVTRLLKAVRRPAGPRVSERAAERARRALTAGQIPPLAVRLAKHRRSAAGGRLHLALGGLGAALGLLAPWAMGAEFFAWPIGAALGTVAGFAAGQGWQRRRTALAGGRETDLAAAFDRLIAEHLPQLAPATRELVNDLCTKLAPLLAASADPRDRALLSTDDVFFVEQLVERYLPDALTAYAAIAPDRRDLPGDGGPTPQQLLHEQITCLQQRLAAIDDGLQAAHARKLARHGRFLAGKAPPDGGAEKG